MTRTIVSITIGWFIAAVAAGATGVFQTDGPPIALALAVTGPVAVALGLLAWSRSFQAWARSLDLRMLTLLQTWRTGGLAFLALWSVGELPAGFALPAGLGDVTVGVTAPFVAALVVGAGHRGNTAFYVWSAFGVLDLVAAVTLGMLHSPTPIGILADGLPDTTVMGSLPMSVIPAFGVPLTLALHAISLYNVRRGGVPTTHSTPGARLSRRSSVTRSPDPSSASAT